MLFNLERRFNSYEAEKYPFTPQIIQFSNRQYNRNKILNRGAKTVRYIKSSSIEDGSFTSTKSCNYINNLVLNLNGSIYNRKKSVSKISEPINLSYPYNNKEKQTYKQNSSKYKISYYPSYLNFKDDRNKSIGYNDLNSSRTILNISSSDGPTYCNKNKNSGNNTAKNSIKYNNNSFSNYYSNPDSNSFIFSTKAKDNNFQIDFNGQIQNSKHSISSMATKNLKQNNRKSKGSFSRDNSNSTNIPYKITYNYSNSRSKYEQQTLFGSEFPSSNSSKVNATLQHPSTTGSKIKKKQKENQNKICYDYKRRKLPLGYETFISNQRTKVSNSLFNPIQKENNSINQSKRNSKEKFFLSKEYSTKSQRDDAKIVSSDKGVTKSMTIDKDNCSCKSENVNRVNSRNQNISSYSRTQDFQVISGVANEIFEHENKSDDLSVSLQSINDSNLYDMANHYLTSDQSLENFRLMNYIKRKGK